MNLENEARRIVRAEMVRRGLTYERLAARLQTIGVDETERSIANKMSRGTFSFVFVLQCMKAMGVNAVSFDVEVETGSPIAPVDTRQASTRPQLIATHITPSR